MSRNDKETNGNSAPSNVSLIPEVRQEEQVTEATSAPQSFHVGPCKPMFPYAVFINELRQLAERGQALFDKQNRAEEDFRRWRYEVADLISRIELQKYRINCRIVYRNIDEHGSYTYAPAPTERLAAFNRDLTDTITEINSLVSHFDKHDAPNVVPSTPPARTLFVDPVGTEPPKPHPPEKITPEWLWRHVTVTLWLQGAVLLAAVFAAGIGLGQSMLYAELSTKIRAPAAMENTLSPSAHVGATH